MLIEAQGVKLEVDHYGGGDAGDDVYSDVYYEDPNKPEQGGEAPIPVFLPLEKLPDAVQAEFKDMVAKVQDMLVKARNLLIL
jgi:hypothetical protein